MNEQQIDPEPALNLPRPRLEQGFAANEANGAGYAGEFGQATAIETGATSGPAPLPIPSAQQAVDTTALAAGHAGAIGLAAQAMPAIADDIDLIEREWVHKAKEIVEHTAGDPCIRNKEMNKVKADYLKKRYNKDLNLEDD